MITDDERREIARKLRKKYEERCARTMGPQDVFIQYYNYLKDLESCLPDCKSMFTLLADLIDPAESGHNQDKNGTCRDESGQCPKTARNCSEPTRNCDREELIRLALELDQKSLELLKTNDLDSNRKRRGMRRAHVSDLMAASSRIRDALGVENG